MTRIFWDTNLFIYFLKTDSPFHERALSLWIRSRDREDEICTSALAVGEVLAGVHRDKKPEEGARFQAGLRKAGVKVLAFDSATSDRFGEIRARHRTSAADSIHLACASTYGVDLLLTHDKDLLKLHIPGIKFIDSIETNLLRPLS